MLLRHLHGSVSFESHKGARPTGESPQHASHFQSGRSQYGVLSTTELTARRSDLETRLRELETKLHGLDIVLESDSVSLLAETASVAATLRFVRGEIKKRNLGSTSSQRLEQPQTTGESLPPSRKRKHISRQNEQYPQSASRGAAIPFSSNFRRHREAGITPKAFSMTTSPSNKPDGSFTAEKQTNRPNLHTCYRTSNASPASQQGRHLRPHSRKSDIEHSTSRRQAISTTSTKIGSPSNADSESKLPSSKDDQLALEKNGVSSGEESECSVIDLTTSKHSYEAKNGSHQYQSRLSLSQPVPSTIGAKENSDSPDFRFYRGKSESLVVPSLEGKNTLDGEPKAAPETMARRAPPDFEYRMAGAVRYPHMVPRTGRPALTPTPPPPAIRAKSLDCKLCRREPSDCICGLKAVTPKPNLREYSSQSAERSEREQSIIEEPAKMPRGSQTSQTSVGDLAVEEKEGATKMQHASCEIVNISKKQPSPTTSDVDFSRFVTQSLREDTPPDGGLALEGYMSLRSHLQPVNDIAKIAAEESDKIVNRESPNTSEEAAQKVSRPIPNVSTEELQTEKPLQFQSTDFDASYLQFSTQLELDRARKSLQDDLQTPAAKISQRLIMKTDGESLDWLGDQHQGLATQDLMADIAPFDSPDGDIKEILEIHGKPEEAPLGRDPKAQNPVEGGDLSALTSRTSNAAADFHSALDEVEDIDDYDVCFSSQINTSNQKPKKISSEVAPHNDDELPYGHPAPRDREPETPQNRFEISHGHPALQLSQRSEPRPPLRESKSNQPTPSGKTPSRSTGTELQDAQKERYYELDTQALGDQVTEVVSFLEGWDLELELTSIKDASSTEASGSTTMKTSTH